MIPFLAVSRRAASITGWALLFALLAPPATSAIFAEFNLPLRSLAPCPDTTEVGQANVARCLVYAANFERGRWNWNLWRQIYAWDVVPGTKDGAFYRLKVLDVFGAPGDSMGVWFDCRNAAGAWLCAPAVYYFRARVP